MCDYLIQTPAGLLPCQETIEHTHVGPGAKEATKGNDLSDVWKEIENIKDHIKRLSDKMTTNGNNR